MCEKKVAECEIACCGADCGNCEWKEKSGCKGCRAENGQMWWGECVVAQCAANRGIDNCLACEDMPCSEMKSLLDHPAHGEYQQRYQNLKVWSDKRDKPRDDN